MFASDHQTHRAIVVLLSQMPALDGLWTEEGATERAWQLRDNDGGALSSGERALLLAACDLWNGHGRVAFRDLLGLDNDALKALCSLLIAMCDGPHAVEGWIASHAKPNAELGLQSAIEQTDADTTDRSTCARCGMAREALIHTGSHPTRCHAFVPRSRG